MLVELMERLVADSELREPLRPVAAGVTAEMVEAS
jgi:hypothetical protein